MSYQMVMFDLLEELSTEAQEFLVGGQQQIRPPKPPVPRPQGGGATGFIVPDNNPDNYYSWRLEESQS
jgi:hypothetical protein